MFATKNKKSTKKQEKEINPITMAEVRSVYERPESFTDLLPYMGYSKHEQTFELEDGVSVAAIFEIQPIGSEARPEEFLQTLRSNIQNVFYAIPEDPVAPWVTQWYAKDEPHLDVYFRDMVRYVKDGAKGSKFTKVYLNNMRNHLKSISREGGLFDDDEVTGVTFRGQIRKVRLVLYKRHNEQSLKKLKVTPDEELNDICNKVENALKSAGVNAKRCDGEYFYNWMLSWFNPKPKIAGGDPEELIKTAPYPGDDKTPFGSDFAESLIFTRPVSDNKTGTWYFDGLPHKCLTISGLRSIPEIGHFTCERHIGEKVCTLMDQMPENTMIAITVVVSTQDDVKAHLEKMKKSAIGDSADAELAKDEAIAANKEIANKNNLYKTNICLYVRADNEKEMRIRNIQLASVLIANRLHVIDEDNDQLALDSYIRNLPMNYEPALDKKRYRSRYIFSKHIANILPLYGRSRGTGHPGMAFFNRGAEPVTADPLSLKDRRKNGHMLFLGPTGAGKSAQLIYVLMHYIAIYNPRIYIIEAGNSFGLFGQYCKALGKTVNQVAFTPDSDISVPPFADAIKILDEAELDIEAGLDNENNAMPEEDAEDKRDILGEMEIVARLMITGGEMKEDARMTRADKLAIRNSIMRAARNVKGEGRDQVMVYDVVTAMRQLGQEEEGKRRERIKEMADGLELFCGEGVEGRFFNRPGTAWPESDVTILEMGLFAREGYEDKLTVAYIGLMNTINNVVEKHQFSNRPTIVVTDEGHIITTNPLLSPYVVKITKMWRKLGAWYWIATQNMGDFPDQAERMLNMMEWWLCLCIPKDEVEQIARFKNLTDEQRSLLIAATKSPGKYTEGVLLSDQLAALFRSVPPSLVLALAMTEKEEKTERAGIMKAHNCTELEAAIAIGKRIDKKRGIAE